MPAIQSPERVFFVPRRDVLLGSYPLAEPVVLVDAALAHRFVGVRELEVCEDPPVPEAAPPVSEALPVFAIDHREAVLYEGARAAIIARDLRDRQVVSANSHRPTA